MAKNDLGFEMVNRAVISADSYLAFSDADCGFSRWIMVDQARIDRFAEATEDRQFIHTDPARAAETAFGGTIAHGALVLSILAGVAEEVLPSIENARMAVNFGFDRIRFITPVACGSRVRANLIVKSVTERGSGVLQSHLLARVDIEHQERPALVADWTILTYV